MSDKRRDSKGRLLRQGELQRNDGKYEYRYIDVRGERRSVYSWKLVDTDKPPQGKRNCKALRDMIKEIESDARDGVDVYMAQRTTLNQCFDSYMETKCGLKQSSRSNYLFQYDTYVRDAIGNLPIISIKYSDIKKFYTNLMRERNLQVGTLNVLHAFLHPVFTTAVRDGLIRSNPTEGVISEIKKSCGYERTKRHALTVPQQEALIDFVKTNDKYKHMSAVLTVFLGTGCRISEISGLRWQDCNFKENTITIDHSLLYHRHGKVEGYKFYISTPKTKAGVRIIPMLSDVRKALINERARQMQYGHNTMEVDGYSGFIFSSKSGKCLTSPSFNSSLDTIVKAYNKKETAMAKNEYREPVLLPRFSAHSLRHTFCTRFCENETNIKVIQEIMGHTDISTTMNVYNEATKEKKMESFANLEGKMKIS